MATHSSILAWRIPGTGEPGWLLSMGLYRVGHDWTDLAAAAYVYNYISSVQSLSCVWLFVTPWTAAHQAFLSITNSWDCSNSCPLSQWCHRTISSPVVPFSSCLRSFSASGSFPVSQVFPSDGQNIRTSASALVLPMNIQDWFPLGFTGRISLQSKGLSQVFSNTTVQKHQFFGAQLSLWSNSYIHIWLLGKP